MTKTYCKVFISAFFMIAFGWVSTECQTPFTTDDAEVTDKGKLHFELLNDYDLLQKALYPSLRQDTAMSSFAYGLYKNIEIGVDVPLLTIFNVRGTTPLRPFGFGDVSLHIKAKILEEKENSRMPALAAAFYIRLPTGSDAKSLGSGVTNYMIYAVAQKNLTNKTKLRLNAGTLIAGNTVIGVLGLRTAKGRLFTGGVSLVKQYNEKLRFGAEFTTVVTSSFRLSKGQLQTTIGGNYNLRKNFTLDFGVIAGRFPASPRAGLLIGFSHDF
jgi:Putative MetA-pathway of phenol degradation